MTVNHIRAIKKALRKSLRIKQRRHKGKKEVDQTQDITEYKLKNTMRINTRQGWAEVDAQPRAGAEAVQLREN